MQVTTESASRRVEQKTMGKVAKRLGIGVKGSVRVKLHRESYAAGDVVQGQLVLRVTRPMECGGE